MSIFTVTINFDYPGSQKAVCQVCRLLASTILAHLWIIRYTGYLQLFWCTLIDNTSCQKKLEVTMLQQGVTGLEELAGPP